MILVFSQKERKRDIVFALFKYNKYRPNLMAAKKLRLSEENLAQNQTLLHAN